MAEIVFRISKNLNVKQLKHKVEDLKETIKVIQKRIKTLEKKQK